MARTADTPLFTCNECGVTELVVTHEYELIKEGYITRLAEWGTLDEDHQVEFDENEAIETFTIDDHHTDKSGTDNHEFYVRCAGCDREIKFGWSHPNRSGRIWPDECSDSNRGRCWPEPRYREGWSKWRS